MAILSTYYLVTSLNECIDSANAHRLPSNEMVVCDLTAGTATIIHILCIIKSNGMLLYKARCRSLLGRIAVHSAVRALSTCSCIQPCRLIFVQCSMSPGAVVSGSAVQRLAPALG